MSRALIYLAAAASLWPAWTAAAERTPATPPAIPPAVQPAAPARAFKVGGMVVDRTGAVIGTIASVVEGDGGSMVVIVQIDGKLVSIPETTLTLAGDNAISTRTKTQILAATNALG